MGAQECPSRCGGGVPRCVETADALESTFGAAPDFTVPGRDEWDRG
jgi:hypothetical protein